MQGNEPTNSAWCPSASCFYMKEVNSEMNYEKGRQFFQLFITEDVWLKDFQGEGRGQLWNILKLNTEFLENSTSKFCCDQLAKFLRKVQ